MANLTIPEEYKSALDRLISLDARQIEALISALDSVGTGPATLPDALVSALKPTSPAGIREILTLINSLYVVRTAQDIPAEHFIDSFARSIASAREAAGLSGENPLSGERLNRLLSIDSVTISSVSIEDNAAEWVQSNLSELLTNYADEWIAVKDNAVVDHSKDLATLIKRLARKGVESPFITQMSKSSATATAY